MSGGGGREEGPPPPDNNHFYSSIPSLCLFAVVQHRRLRCVSAETVLMLEPDSHTHH